MSSTETASYTGTAKFLHWLIALLIIFMLALGWSFDYLPKGEVRFFAFQLHKSIGITILLLSIARLAWRLLHRAPPLPAAMPKWEQGAAHLGHFVLYAAMLIMPLSGWLLVSSGNHNVPTILYGLVSWPAFPGVAASDYREQINHLSGATHGWLATIFAFLIVGHAAAAWRHHLFVKDDVLLRMAPKVLAKSLNRLRGQV